MFKGAIIDSYRRHLLSTFGQPAYADMARRLPERSRDTLETSAFNPSRKYPVEVLFSYLDAVEAQFGRDVLFQLGRVVGQQDLTGMHKVFIMMSSVEGTLTLLTRAWRFYYDEGNAEIVDKKPHCWIAAVNDQHLRPCVMETVKGYIAYAVELAGGKDVRVKSVVSPKPHAFWFQIDWK